MKKLFFVFLLLFCGMGAAVGYCGEKKQMVPVGDSPESGLCAGVNDGRHDAAQEEGESSGEVETMPSFKGGDLGTFIKWVHARVNPAVALKNGIVGKVFVSFVIETDGTLDEIRVLRSPDKSLSDEVIRVLKRSPKWSPAMQGGQPVRVTFTMPVNFQIGD